MERQSRPLTHLTVMDCGMGRPGALVARLLSDLGTQTHRIEPASGDPFYAVYPAYSAWRHGQTIVTAETIREAIDDSRSVLTAADILIVGGEDFPGLAWRPDVAALAAAYPRLIILDITAGLKGTPDEFEPGVELLAQARTGLVFEQRVGRPAVFAFNAASYGAALEGLIGVFAALCAREGSGQGQVVSTSLTEGVLTWLRQVRYSFPRPDEVADGKTPKGVHPLIFRCQDGDYIHFVLGAVNARRDVYTVLGIEDPSPSLDEDPHGLPSLSRGIRDFCGDIDLLQSYVGRWRRSDLLNALWAKGVPAEAVAQPGECWSDPQVAFNGVIETQSDRQRRVGIPFRMETGPVHSPSLPVPPQGVGPLAGVRVLDLGSFIAGPHSSLPLVDLGADVIKVEALGGDVMRRYFRAYTASSRGKRSLAIDLKKPEGRDIFLKLCGTAGMVHHNFRPGVTQRLDIEAATLMAVKPDLIVLETAGYGVAGPHAERGGFDMIFQAFCGHEHLASGEGNPPENYVIPTIDLGAGLIGAIASLAAEYGRARGACGAVLATSLLDTGIYLLSDLVQFGDGDFSPLPALNRDQTGFHPAERLYQARDGWLAVAARDDAMAGRLIEALGIGNVVRTRRQDWSSTEAACISEAIGPLDLHEVETRLRDAQVWMARCVMNAEAQMLSDPAMERTGAVVTAEHPVYGHTRQLGKLYSLSGSATTAAADWAGVGQHTRTILEELGYDTPTIERLYAEKVVA